MYIVGRRSDQVILKVSGSYSTNPPQKTILEWAVEKFGGNEDDYDVFFLDDTSNKAIRIQNRDDFDPIWELKIKDAGTPEETQTWVITGVSFDPEENKKWLKFSCDKNSILANNTQTTDITLEVWDAKKIAIDTTVNTNLLVDIQTPTRTAKMKFQIVNGVSIKSFATLDYGEWIIPMDPVRVNGLRVDKQITINALVP